MTLRLLRSWNGLRRAIAGIGWIAVAVPSRRHRCDLELLRLREDLDRFLDLVVALQAIRIRSIEAVLRGDDLRFQRALDELAIGRLVEVRLDVGERRDVLVGSETRELIDDLRSDNEVLCQLGMLRGVFDAVVEERALGFEKLRGGGERSGLHENVRSDSAAAVND